ncbi:MAG: glycosyltransferase family 1 protein [Bacilli bacterium]
MIITTPKRILQVVGAMNRAGTETMLMNVYRNIDRTKIQFDFISYSDQEADYDQEIKELGGRVFHLSKSASIKEIYTIIKSFGPYEAVHSHTLFHCGIANLAALLAGIKIRIAHAHTTLDDNKSFIRKVYIFLMRNLIKVVSSNLLACSNAAGSYLYGERILTKHNYSFFPNVIDYAPFITDEQAAVKKFKQDEGLEYKTVIGHIGRFVEAKNHQFLLELLKCMLVRDPNVIFLLVGDGDLRKKIEEIAKKEGVYEHIRFVGVRKDIPILLKSMDTFVFPSLHEGLGLVLLEAQASGLPCFVSEAIQPEADLELGLFYKLTLEDGPEVWAKQIIKNAHLKEKNKQKIIQAFINHGFIVEMGIEKLMNLYNVEGGNDEKRINSFI